MWLRGLFWYFYTCLLVWAASEVLRSISGRMYWCQGFMNCESVHLKVKNLGEELQFEHCAANACLNILLNIWELENCPYSRDVEDSESESQAEVRHAAYKYFRLNCQWMWLARWPLLERVRGDYDRDNIQSVDRYPQAPDCLLGDFRDTSSIYFFLIFLKYFSLGCIVTILDWWFCITKR